MQQFSKEQMQKARKTDLYAFLMAYHAGQFTSDGTSLPPVNNHSLSIKRGYSGYKDFATDETGNSVDFLTKHLGYQLDDAVFALIGEKPNMNVHLSCPEPTQKDADKADGNPAFPEPVNGTYKNLFAYLMRRGISQNTIQMLVDSELMYQEKEHNNIVFINRDKDWGELHGTYSMGEKSFHGMVANCRHDGCWWFKNCTDKPTVAYICESAIDAISLYELHQLKGQNMPAYYVSIGGAGKQDTIDRIVKLYRVIMSVDNDKAGSDCRRRNASLESVIPINKDWNEDLIDARTEKPIPTEKPKEEPKTAEPSAESPSDIPADSLEKIIAEGVAEGVIPEGWTDPYNSPEHARFMIDMMRKNK